jgi:hypothetical protein
MKTYVYIHILLTSALVGDGELHDPAALPPNPQPRERALGTHLIGVWVGPRGGLDDVEKRNS